MMGSNDDPEKKDGWKRGARAGISAIGGAIPFAGGFFSAVSGYWSERDQERVNDFLRAWIKMLEDELREKQNTLAQIVERLDIYDDEIAERIKSDAYQSLVRKAFRNWSGAESEKKREFVRNILSNAAATDLTSDDVISLFIDWLQTYSEFHFEVIGAIYRQPGTTRGQIWQVLGKGPQREDSAEADLYKLLFRDLSTGGIVRQHRPTDYAGNFLPKPRAKPRPKGSGPAPIESAFEAEKPYELTALGQQFVHYAMTDIPVKIEYRPTGEQNHSD